MAHLTITDETAEKALRILAGTRHAIAKMVFERTDREKKALLARLERESEGKTLRDRETYALTHPHYSALKERLDAAEAEYYEAKDERDSANTILDVWRTLKADARAAERAR